MSTTADLARRWYREVWAPGGERTVADLMAEHVDGYMEGKDIHTRAEFLEERERLLCAFPDLRIEAEDVVEDGEKAVVRWTVTATHQGDSLGIPPTHRRVHFRGLTWMEFKNGRLVRGWDSWNLGALLNTLSEREPAASATT
jgi:steroid delta-isomerase-like uncharacterized protein